jgi:GNAT superfamily N-acetyltransferase
VPVRGLPVYSSAMRERPALFLGLLADQPELIAEVGTLRWRASGSEGTPGRWIESTARDAGREGLPLTLVAMGLDGRAIGAVTLGAADENAGTGGTDRTPWLVRMIVSPDERRCGVGRLMVAAIEDLARDLGHTQVWVAAGSNDVEFYRHCGWQEAGVGSPDGNGVTILSRELARLLP